MKKYSEDLTVLFKDYSQLSYEDLDAEYVQLFIDNKIIGLVEIQTDVENLKREYIIINYEIIYLDSIKRIV